MSDLVELCEKGGGVMELFRFVRVSAGGWSTELSSLSESVFESGVFARSFFADRFF